MNNQSIERSKKRIIFKKEYLLTTSNSDGSNIIHSFIRYWLVGVRLPKLFKNKKKANDYAIGIQMFVDLFKVNNGYEERERVKSVRSTANM